MNPSGPNKVQTSAASARALKHAGRAPNPCDLLTVAEDIQALKQIVTKLVAEVHALRQERLPVSSEIIQELCAAIYGACGRQPFTSAMILDWAIKDVDKNTEPLSRAIIHATGPKPDPNTLSRLLTRACGQCGPWRLTLYRARTNQGKLFQMEKLR